MGSRTPPRFVTRTMTTTFGTVVIILGLGVEVMQALATAIPTLRRDDNRFDTGAARAARKSILVALARP